MSPKGYVLEVELEYPDKLHELHNHYPPLAPEKLSGIKVGIKLRT